MPTSFNMDNLPFCLLNEKDQKTLRSNLDIGYYKKGEMIIAAGAVPDGVHVIFKGRVLESEAGEDNTENVFVHYQNEDYFGAWSSIKGNAIHNFIAEEETICHIIPTKILLDLMSINELFADYFKQSLTIKTGIANKQSSQNMDEFMLAKVNQGFIHDPYIVDEDKSIQEATVGMKLSNNDSILVQRGNRYGMVTGTDLLKAVVIEELPLTTKIGDIAKYRIISMSADDYLFNALIIMTQQHIERVVVVAEQKPIGIVQLTDVLSFFSSNSHAIGLRIVRAQTVDDLRQVTYDLNNLIIGLDRQGVKPRFIMDLISAMNERIFVRLFDLLIPIDIQPHVCLIIMGSEGRGEQIMKTDQDNALIYRDGLQWRKMQNVLNSFTAQLIEFGYPPCPGNIMVSNQKWVNSFSEWNRKLVNWSSGHNWTPEDQMNLAIAIDAKAVAGNPALFKAARNRFFSSLHGNKVFFSYFVQAALQFDTPLTFFGNLKNKDELDVKKGSIFPIVHGVRTLALENKILVTNTYKRLEILAETKVVDQKLANELSDALSLFIKLRLNQQIQRLNLQTSAESINSISIDKINKMERDLLRDALHIVKRFKQFLEDHYQLATLP